MEARLRRYQDTLAISGVAVVVLAAWNLIKPFFYVFYRPESVLDMLGLAIEDYEFVGTALVFTLVVFAIEFLLLLFVGMAASAESRSRKHGRFYIVLAIVMLVLRISAIFTTISDAIFGRTSPETIRATLLIDIATTFALCEIIWSSIQVKRTSTRLAEDASGGVNAS